MLTLTLSAARAQLFPLVDQLDKTGPIHVRGRGKEAILLSKTEWESWQETMFLMKDPVLMRRITKDRAIRASGRAMPQPKKGKS